MKTLEVPDSTFEELIKISEWYGETPGNAVSGIHNLMGAVAAHNKEIRKIVYPSDQLCQICGEIIFTDKEKARRACNACFNKEMKDIHVPD